MRIQLLSLISWKALTKGIISLFAVILLFTPAVLAQQGSGNSQAKEMVLDLTLPKELTGDNVILKDGAGKVIQETKVDSMGKTELHLDSGNLKPNIVINSEQIMPQETEKEDQFTKEDLIFISLAVSLTVFIIAFYLGRKSSLWILRELRDYIYEEKLD